MEAVCFISNMFLFCLIKASTLVGMDTFSVHAFDQLAPDQQQRLLAFLHSSGSPVLPSDPEAMARFYGGTAFSQGRTHWSGWRDGQPVAALGMVTEAHAACGEIYLTQIHAEAGGFPALESLLERALAALGPYHPCRLKLIASALVPELAGWAEARGFQRTFSLVEMRWSGLPPERPGRLAWQPVTEAEADAFRTVSNAAFSRSPNGRLMDPEAMADLLETLGRTPGALQLGQLDGAPAVALSLELRSSPDGPEGIIDGLAVHPDFQGRGLGREGLHQGLRTLLAQGLDRITLAVIDRNEPAVALYHAEGFAPVRTLSCTFTHPGQEALHEP
jgi:ribosomal protein S18 acetylase RimI-like enzyme